MYSIYVPNLYFLGSHAVVPRCTPNQRKIQGRAFLFTKAVWRCVLMVELHSIKSHLIWRQNATNFPSQGTRTR